MDWWQTTLLSVLTAGVGIMLTMLLNRNKDANALAHKAINSTRAQFEVIETLKTISWLQAVRLDEWENWGREATQVFNETARIHEECGCNTSHLPRMPSPPEGHLDLRRYWRQIEEAVADKE
ncbi:hypothetical protein Wildcat_48 [Mycobacterium phage Wildcat]|uniref:Uncharacterized protein n=4 Tax=Mycobacterium virus Wildcat TaxID=1993859 RepID=Q19Y12_9CAUD|nr:hypothetical protein Wildcat_48 [Mycobacterium phage Wildcat]AJD82120.1 hypothetical protein COSMO_48 [Mycobacterium phage Cosmo]AQT25720.1 hypothetical protein EniyanLRS_45 [Mycobacterium phage EniyanLRS]QGJ89938.1 hypothetical protein PBI_MARYV_48 [Mycobacterium phage MaryV]WKR36058.1 hypothetical protein [Mycobacterium phage Azrael100]ABE67653.1 hypothetical protein Wildcat_48 [Mycobacterium phage Wildcat]